MKKLLIIALFVSLAACAQVSLISTLRAVESVALTPAHNGNFTGQACAPLCQEGPQLACPDSRECGSGSHCCYDPCRKRLVCREGDSPQSLEDDIEALPALDEEDRIFKRNADRSDSYDSDDRSDDSNSRDRSDSDEDRIFKRDADRSDDSNSRDRSDSDEDRIFKRDADRSDDSNSRDRSDSDEDRIFKRDADRSEDSNSRDRSDSDEDRNFKRDADRSDDSNSRDRSNSDENRSDDSNSRDQSDSHEDRSWYDRSVDGIKRIFTDHAHF